MGSSTRTVRRIIAEPREDFLARAEQQRTRAVELRAQGLKYREIADEMGISIGTVGSLIHNARKLEQPQDVRDAG